MTRALRVSHPKMYNQILVDMYYFYTSCIFIVFVLFSGNQVSITEFDASQLLYKEELHNLSGLVNEVLSSLKSRITGDEKTFTQGLEESTMLTICEVNWQKLFA